MCVLVYNDKQWRKFFDMIGKPGLMDDDLALRHHRRAHQTHRRAVQDGGRGDADAYVRRMDHAARSRRHAGDELHTIDSLLADPHPRRRRLLRRGGTPQRGRDPLDGDPVAMVKDAAKRGAPGPTAGRAQRRSAGRGRALAPTTSASWPRRAPRVLAPSVQ
ncbi:hypothetical protein ACU4GD_20530 [Cupriavidus basilensis]